MVRQHADRVHLNAEAPRREREDVEEDGGRLLRRSEKKCPLRASTGDEIRGSWKNLARCGHTVRRGMNRADETRVATRSSTRGGTAPRSVRTNRGTLGWGGGVGAEGS